MAKTYRATRFRHPGIFDGGGPAICHAGYQARLDQAALFRYRWKEPKKALAIYEDLMKADPVARTYQGTVPAWAANERAGLLREMKRYQSALEAYRQVVSKHGKHYWQRGMYVSASEAALYRMKQICLEDLKSPALWKSETAELKKLIKDPKLSKRLNQLSDRNGGP
jgi:tetratricopeptide (TPR) repeat protein